MDSGTYCREAIGTLRTEQGGSLSDPTSYQVIVLLSSFGQQDLSPRDFTTALNLLIERSERSAKPKVAEAARTILSDWQSRSPLG